MRALALGFGLLILFGGFGAKAAVVFDPVPTADHLSAPERANIRTEILSYMASVEGVAPEQITLGEAKMWSKASGNGFVACVTMPPQNGRQLSYVAVITVAKGPLGSAPFMKKVWDNQTYGYLGCNTASPVLF